MTTDGSASIVFGAIAFAMTAAAFAWVLRPLLARRARARRTADAAAPDAGRLPAKRIGLAAALLVPALAAALYAWLGDFRAVDERRTLDAQAAIDTVPAGVLREDLAANVARNPRDARSWILLARMDFAGDRFADAATAYANALAANANVGKDPGVWCEYADALGMAQGGTLAGRPRELVAQALVRDPGHPKALELAGSAAFEEGDFAAAARHWRALLAQLPPASAEHRELAAAIARADLSAGAGVR
ncbi:MAG: hypothetical protein IPM22_05235 [Betaproteobacteria bacterium]|nr:hypothetical protein [Betaproteobacteria bacterium]